MKKLVVNLELCLILLVFFALNTKAQTNCHALYSSQQNPNSLLVAFVDLSTSQNNIVSWSWDFGDGSNSTLQNPSHNYNQAGSFIVCLMMHDDHGCSSHFCNHITVNSMSHLDCKSLFSFHQDATTLSVNFLDSSISSSNIITWEWNFGDGGSSNIENPTYTYGHSGSYSVCLTIHDDHGCTDHYCHQIVVEPISPSCHAGFSFVFDSMSNIFYFKNNSVGTTNHTTYQWEFGNGDSSTDENPQYSYLHSGHYLVCLYIHDISTGCSSHYCHDLNFNHDKHHFHNVEAQSAFDAPIYSQHNLSKSWNPLANFSNPVISSSGIQFELLQDGELGIEIFNLNGIKISSFSNEVISKGNYYKEISNGLLSNGLYFLKVKFNNQTYVEKISILNN